MGISSLPVKIKIIDNFSKQCAAGRFIFFFVDIMFEQTHTENFARVLITVNPGIWLEQTRIRMENIIFQIRYVPNARIYL